MSSQLKTRPKKKPNDQFTTGLRLAALETKLSNLEEAADKNTRTFSDSLQMAEAMLFVFQRYQNDVLNGILRLVDGRIDFHSYIVEYWLCIDVMPRFIQWLTENSPKQEAAPPSEEDGAFVFGGN